MSDKLSICLITKNEEQMLPGCLDSVREAADEIILVDTGSTDGTLSIAKKYGCIIYEIPWENDFAKARNVALSYASCPFILSIDADERLENPDELLDIINNAKSSTAGWLVRVVSEAKRKDGSVDTYISNLLRLFRNNSNIRFSGLIHEQIIEAVIDAGYKLENTSIEFIHHGYSYSAEAMTKKQRRNLELLNAALKNEPGNGYHLYQRAKTYLALNDLEKAEIDITESLKYVKPDGAVKPQALNFGGIISFQRKDYETAISRANESLGIVPNQAFANFILGETYSAQNRFAEAYDAYKRMNEASGKKDLLAAVVGDYYLPPEQLSFRIGRSLVGLKMYNEALNEFEKGLRINPRDIGCIVGAANVAFFHKKYDESKMLLENAITIQPGRQDLNNFLKQVENAIMLDSPEGADRVIGGQEVREKENVKNNIDDVNSVIKDESYSSTDKPLISLCMIVKNEEEQLPGCLESVKGIADEIVIVDTGSTDRTKLFAQSHNARVIDFTWINDFAAARNEALKHCTGIWILYLDADERLLPESSGNLRNLLTNLSDNIGGLICTISSDHVQLDGNTEKHRGGYPRIFRNYGYPNIQFQGRVHEQITQSIFALGKSIAVSDVVIEHLGYNQKREVMEDKIRRNYKMLIQHVQDEPLNGYAWYQLGQTLAQMQLAEEAENAVRFALQIGSLSSSVYASAASTLAQLVGNKKNFTESLFWSERSLEKAPEQVYALHLKAYSLLYLNRLDEAESCFIEVRRRMNAKKGVPFSGFDIEIPEQIIDKGLSEIMQRRSKSTNNN